MIIAISFALWFVLMLVQEWSHRRSRVRLERVAAALIAEAKALRQALDDAPKELEAELDKLANRRPIIDVPKPANKHSIN